MEFGHDNFVIRTVAAVRSTKYILLFICLCLYDIAICFQINFIHSNEICFTINFFNAVKETTGGVSRVSCKGERGRPSEEADVGRSSINDLFSRVFKCKLCDVTFSLKYQYYVSV